MSFFLLSVLLETIFTAPDIRHLAVVKCHPFQSTDHLVPFVDRWQRQVDCIWIECLHSFSVLDNLTPFVLGALKMTPHVSQSVLSQPVKLLKAYYFEYASVIHPEKVASRKHFGNGPTSRVSTYRHLHAHRFNRYSVVIPFINPL